MGFHRVWDGVARLDARVGFSSAVPNRSNRVVMYHSVGDPELFGNVSPARLRDDIEHMCSHYEVVDLPAALEECREKRVALTFDDGYENFYTEAYPILKEYDVPATVFVIPATISRDGPESNVDPTHCMDADQLETLAEDDLVTLGNHTLTHPRLSVIDDEARLREEIVGGKRELERRFDITVERFCYPHGSVHESSAALVEKSHESSLAVGLRHWWYRPGAKHRVTRVRGHDPPHQLRWKLSDASSTLARSISRLGLVESEVTG